MSGGLFFEGVDGPQVPADAFPESPYLDEMRSRLAEDPSVLGALEGPELDVDRVARWALVAGPVDAADDRGHPGTAVHLFHMVLQDWKPVSGATGSFLPSWVRRSSGRPLELHGAGEYTGVRYVAVDVRHDVASVELDGPERRREVDTREGPGIVAILLTDTTTVRARDSAGNVMESHIAAEIR